MSDSEEDYMSDKFLSECAKQDVRPGLLFKASDKRSFEIYKNEQEISKKPKRMEPEKERREKGLSTAISSENKGFKILEKMGFTMGSGLGKSSDGIKEPVKIALKTNSSGLGREEHLKEKTKRNFVRKHEKLQAVEEMFRVSRTEKQKVMHMKKDIWKGQRICEDLDMKQGIDYPHKPYLWQRSTMTALKKEQKRKLFGDSSEIDEDTDSSSDEEELYNDEILCNIITYLRTTYNYCIYCGDYIDSTDSECPGYFRNDHDT